MPAVRTTTTPDARQLETFENPAAGGEYTIRIRTAEFTCLCPRTGQPDFATLTFEYVPALRCIELKALKQYLWSFRNEGAFHEAVTNRMLADLVAVLEPKFLRVTAEFNVRGGLYTSIVVEHRHRGWQPPSPVSLPPAGTN
jgi:7-cyano-7-deazaguanine reductase